VRKMGENSPSITGRREGIFANIATMLSRNDDGPKKLTTGAIEDNNAIYNPKGLAPPADLLARAGESVPSPSTQPSLVNNMFGAPPEALDQYLASLAPSQQRQS
jgi:hypothetical protein